MSKRDRKHECILKRKIDVEHYNLIVKHKQNTKTKPESRIKSAIGVQIHKHFQFVIYSITDCIIIIHRSTLSLKQCEYGAVRIVDKGPELIPVIAQKKQTKNDEILHIEYDNVETRKYEKMRGTQTNG